MHAYQKERLGWLNYSASPAIQTVSSSGSYRISAYEGGSSPSALKILKSATSSDKTYYYVEARTPVGFDGPYAGVVMHTGNSSNGNTANQVDMDPVTATFDPQLDPGQSFSDAAASLTVTTISVDDSGAWVSITYAGQPCTTSTPAVTLSPGSSVTQPSVTSSYTMTVKNNDGSGCPSTGFGIGLVIPSGWGWSASQPQLSVAPGTTAGTTVYVTPPAGASGSTTVTATAARTESGPSGSASATLVVANALSVVLTATGGSQYQVSVTVKAGGAPASGAQVNFVLVDPKGGSSSFSGVTNSSGVATIKGRLKGKDPKGTYTVSVSVTSGNLTGSAAGSFVY